MCVCILKFENERESKRKESKRQKGSLYLLVKLIYWSPFCKVSCPPRNGMLGLRTAKKGKFRTLIKNFFLVLEKGVFKVSRY